MSLRVRYLMMRIFRALIAIFLLTTVTFFLMHLMPGDPFTGKKAISDQLRLALESKYGLDKSLFVQFFIYIKNIFCGDFGVSLISGRSVTDIIAQAFPVSMDLGLRALVLALIFGISLGMVAAIKKDTVWDTLAVLITLIGVSIPISIISSLIQYFLSLRLYEVTQISFFPVMGWDTPASKILPPIALAISAMTSISRLMRSSMVDTLNQNYVRTARAKGLSNRRVVFSHCLRNAIIPIISVLGPLVTVLMTGTFVVENIFSIPGLGKYFVESVQTNDYPVIIGTTLFFGTFLVAMNLLMDILHCLLDPRVQLDQAKE